MKLSDIDKMLGRYITVRTKRLELDKQSAEMKAEESMILDSVKAELLGRDLVEYQPKGAMVKAKIDMKAFADVFDWDTLWKHIQRTGEFDLLQKRVTVTAVRQRWEVGAEVPGVKQSQEPEISIVKVKP